MTYSFRRWLPWGYGLVVLAAIAYSHFAELINDVFLLRWQADRLSFHHPSTFYNGFFPIGYPLLLRFFSWTGNPIFTLILAQIALAAFYALLLYRFLERITPKRSIIIGLPFVLFAPPFLHSIPSATPDFLSAWAVLAGLILIVKRSNFFLGFLCMGIGYFFRVHVLIFAVTLCFALVFTYKESRLRVLTGFCAGVLPFVLLQGLVQVFSGHHFFENAQAFNIWKTMHGIDWSNPPLLQHTTAIGTVLADPVRFGVAALSWLLHYIFYLLPLVAVLALGTKKQRMNQILFRSLRMLAWAALIYILLVSGGGSISAFTPVLPIIGACLAVCLEYLLSFFPTGSRRIAFRFVVILLWSVSIIGYAWFSQRERNRIEEYAKVERAVRTAMGTLDPHRLYTDDYDLYFPGTPYLRPKTSGSWGELGLPNYTKEFPHICDTSADAEHHDLSSTGTTFAIFRIPPYDPRGYENVRNDTTDFRLIAHTDAHDIYRIMGTDLR